MPKKIAKPKSNKLKLIDQIEKIRGRNNVNWMNLVRLAFEVAPDRAALIFRKINTDDKRIAKLLEALGR